jgi:hypothetical protein
MGSEYGNPPGDSKAGQFWPFSRKLFPVGGEGKGGKQHERQPCGAGRPATVGDSVEFLNDFIALYEVLQVKMSDFLWNAFCELSVSL